MLVFLFTGKLLSDGHFVCAIGWFHVGLMIIVIEMLYKQLLKAYDDIVDMERRANEAFMLCLKSYNSKEYKDENENGND